MSKLMESIPKNILVPAELQNFFESKPSYTIIDSREQLMALATNKACENQGNVSFEVNGKSIIEANVVKCANGLSVNFPESHMRRRDPKGMLIGDELPTDKDRYRDRFGSSFDDMKTKTLGWLKKQKLLVSIHPLGDYTSAKRYCSILIVPENCAFFSATMADMQGIVSLDDLSKTWQVKSVMYLAPPFRHSVFNGKQIVVHHRSSDLYEIFAYHLYPGPSAKNGMYGPLLSLNESEDWLLLRASTVQVETPYDNVTTIMHEGAGGSGKSEMLEYAQRTEDGRLLIGENILNNEKRHLLLPRGCVLHPLSDDMAVSPIHMEDEITRAIISDAEKAWFIRLDHITHYGVDPVLEKITIHPSKPLLFYNLKGTENATCLIWEHSEDSLGFKCNNPRVVLPRALVPARAEGSAEVHLRNFGLCCPPCTSEKPSYGILGYLHLLPPALAWLWRVVSPHGSHLYTSLQGMALWSEGVGSFGPFTPARKVEQAEKLLQHILKTPNTRFSLTPNQYVGAWHVGFMPQWVAREFLARRGVAPFKKEQLQKARASILGYTLRTMQIEGLSIPSEFLRVNEQEEVGTESYDYGAELLNQFFKKELQPYVHSDLGTLGKQIIECCMTGGSVEDYETLIPH